MFHCTRFKEVTSDPGDFLNGTYTFSNSIVVNKD